MRLRHTFSGVLLHISRLEFVNEKTTWDAEVSRLDLVSKCIDKSWVQRIAIGVFLKSYHESFLSFFTTTWTHLELHLKIAFVNFYPTIQNIQIWFTVRIAGCGKVAICQNAFISAIVSFEYLLSFAYHTGRKLNWHGSYICDRFQDFAPKNKF